MEKTERPGAHVGEITLIGTGGYGETIVIHLGNGHWAIVDSCINPNTNQPQALDYLRSMDVDLPTEVKLIVCTHWHNDHILGISRVLEECKSAKLSFSKAHDREKFLKFISFDYEKSRVDKANSATYEFNKCIDIANARGQTVVAAIENKPLYTIRISGTALSQLIALSPSDYTLEKFDHEISTLITEFGAPSKKMPANDPNAKSVALLVKLGSHRAILGADLEVSADPREGWVNILNSSHVIDHKASLYKIPHHGSENGYHARIFSELLVASPIAKLTPWNKGLGLPVPEMLKKYCDHSDQVYMTKAQAGRRAKDRDKRLEKFIRTLDRNLEEMKYARGVIRCRIDMNDSMATWETVLLENSIHVNKLLGHSENL